ncbi:flp operon protein C [Bisgaard Taxon 10/6]|uniref:flp operon protein C n=1 Tax=Exercitatus varius TaxID=67857 RepID=UPI00294B1819|nr:flp operon protein C [Exercitatus varius]MDG2957069.1 flp operon protein C [Exercitatus varius]MDG2964737.1 flp operon protein C [Exercitatus varius]
MNYRVLFIISFLILAMGLSGLFFMFPDENQSAPAQNQTAGEQPAAKRQTAVLLAQTTRSVPQGALLQAGDYAFNELSVDSDDPRLKFDLKPLFENTDNYSLQGYLVKQPLQAGSFLSANLLLSPQHPDYLFSSLDPKREVPYRIYIKYADRYIFDSLKNGVVVSISSQQAMNDEKRTERNTLIRLIDNAVVLQTKIYTQDEQLLDKDRNIFGYVTVKLDAEQMKKLYSLPKDANLIVLPNNEPPQGATNHRGIYVRKLRGQ